MGLGRDDQIGRLADRHTMRSKVFVSTTSACTRHRPCCHKTVNNRRPRKWSTQPYMYSASSRSSMAPASKGAGERGGAVGARRRLARQHDSTAARWHVGMAARRHGGRSRSTSRLLLPVLELVTLLGLNLEDVARLERERLVRGHQVAAHLAQAGRLERGRVVSACREERGEGAGRRNRHSDGTRGSAGRGAGEGAPFHVRSLVKWRSTHLAPRVYAAMSMAMPRWWPEKAISLTRWVYSSFSRLISSMQTSGKGTG